MVSDTLIFVVVIFTFIQFQVLSTDENWWKKIDNIDGIFVLWCACGIFFNLLVGILGHVFSSYGLYFLLSVLFYDFVIPMVGLVYFFIVGYNSDNSDNEKDGEYK